MTTPTAGKHGITTSPAAPRPGARAAFPANATQWPTDGRAATMKLAAAKAPTAQEEDDDDKAALWLPGGDSAAAAEASGKAAAVMGAGSAAGAVSSGEAGAAVAGGANAVAANAAAAAGATGAAGATASALVGQVILGTFAVAAAANQHDSGTLGHVSARGHLSTGRGNSEESGSRTDDTTGTSTPTSRPDSAGSHTSAPQANGAGTSTANGQTDSGNTNTAAGQASNTDTATAQADSSSTQTTGGQAESGTSSNADTSPHAGSGTDDATAGKTETDTRPQPGNDASSDTMPQAPALPTYAENATVAYALDENKAIGASVFTGTNADTAPDFVRITAIRAKSGDAAEGTMLLQDGDAITVDRVIARADFEKILWDASKSEGGSFSFVPVQDAQGTTLQGAIEQTVTIDESPLPQKAYPLASYHFNPVAEFPPHVKIEAITETNDTNGIVDGLVRGDGTFIKEGDMLKIEDFGRMFWNHSSNEGGSIKITPYNAAMDSKMDPGTYEMGVTPSAPSEKGPQEVMAASSRTAPTYKPGMSVDFAFDESKPIGADIFLGTKAETAPSHVYIMAIQGKDGGNAAAGTMSLEGGDAIRAGQIIAQADFGRIIWDASKNEGGSFSFIPVGKVEQLEGIPIRGATPQTVTIDEAAEGHAGKSTAPLDLDQLLGNHAPATISTQPLSLAQLTASNTTTLDELLGQQLHLGGLV